DRVEFGSRRVEAREGGAALLGEGGRGRAEAQRGAAEGGLAAAEVEVSQVDVGVADHLRVAGGAAGHVGVELDLAVGDLQAKVVDADPEDAAVTLVGDGAAELDDGVSGGGVVASGDDGEGVGAVRVFGHAARQLGAAVGDGALDVVAEGEFDAPVAATAGDREGRGGGGGQNACRRCETCGHQDRGGPANTQVHVDSLCVARSVARTRGGKVWLGRGDLFTRPHPKRKQGKANLTLFFWQSWINVGKVPFFPLHKHKKEQKECGL